MSLSQSLREVLRKVRRRFDSDHREIRRLASLPHRESAETDLLGPTLRLTDPHTFLYMYKSIFEQGVYAFSPERHPPTIVDAGANIGLATIYWKRQFPDAKIKAFEPGPHLSEAFQINMHNFGFGDVELYQAALSTEEGETTFHASRGSGGHLGGQSTDTDTEAVNVPVTRLSKHLDGHVDMLKIDVEGAEVDVIRDIKSHLTNVSNLFVEYHSYAGEEQHIDEIIYALSGAGFRLYFNNERNADQPFIRRPLNNGMDQNLQIFAYRE